jgi:D-arabinose 1-dehydrogenase-like Zn-dependent alcohol dehydrogenase
VSGNAVPGTEQPFAIGHEGVGEVVEIGSAVSTAHPARRCNLRSGSFG